MDHEAMAEFLERLRKDLEDSIDVNAVVVRNDHGKVSGDTPLRGFVTALKHGGGGNTIIEVQCFAGALPWEFSSRTPALEKLSSHSYKLYNGPSWLTLEFTR